MFLYLRQGSSDTLNHSQFHVGESSCAEKDLLLFLPYLAGVSSGFGIGGGWVCKRATQSPSP